MPPGVFAALSSYRLNASPAFSAITNRPVWLAKLSVPLLPLLPLVMSVLPVIVRFQSESTCDCTSANWLLLLPLQAPEQSTKLARLVMPVPWPEHDTPVAVSEACAAVPIRRPAA